MSADVAIVDYGIGNLLSVRRAFEHCGASPLDWGVRADRKRVVVAR